ncbi:hypothetical protein, partial [Streptomyces sp. NPDC002133]|uniref:hypothetical protein n=1 Tax=Streptomyces sp. NPDC002133 TaxID=3154409 RepID=UPI00331B91B5
TTAELKRVTGRSCHDSILSRNRVSIRAGAIHEESPRRETVEMASAIFGFVGVLLGSLTTSILTIYKDRLAARHETMIRDQQYERDRQAARDDFQRESIQTLQTAVSEAVSQPITERAGRTGFPPG